MEKPREFWIREKDGHFPDGSVNDAEEFINSILVIEKSAYDEKVKLLE